MMFGWFDVNTGQRQGYSLSSVLLSRFINDLAVGVKNLTMELFLKMSAFLSFYMQMILFYVQKMNRVTKYVILFQGLVYCK
jgi:hypothetical protein